MNFQEVIQVLKQRDTSFNIRFLSLSTLVLSNIIAIMAFVDTVLKCICNFNNFKK